MTDPLAAERAAALAQIEALNKEFEGVVDASRASNADDEHDPEGATIAFERQQVAALLEQARRRLADVEVALAHRRGRRLRHLRELRPADRTRAARRPAGRAYLHRLRPLRRQGSTGSAASDSGAPASPGAGSAAGSVNRDAAAVAPASASAARTTAAAVHVVRSTGQRASSA